LKENKIEHIDNEYTVKEFFEKFNDKNKSKKIIGWEFG
jgi:hypothetical protein